jgi:hypothetical protein
MMKIKDNRSQQAKLSKLYSGEAFYFVFDNKFTKELCMVVCGTGQFLDGCENYISYVNLSQGKIGRAHPYSNIRPVSTQVIVTALEEKQDG